MRKVKQYKAKGYTNGKDFRMSSWYAFAVNYFAADYMPVAGHGFTEESMHESKAEWNNLRRK